MINILKTSNNKIISCWSWLCESVTGTMSFRHYKKKILKDRAVKTTFNPLEILHPMVA